jgi:CRISPR-associated protein Csb2
MSRNVLHGHTREDHIAWVPLPYVGGAHGTGRIMGIAAMLPASLTEEDYQVHMAAVQSMTNASDGYISRHFRMDYRAKAAALHPQRWRTPSQVWRSVSPVVWVGHPRPNRNERIVAKMCSHIGLPAPKAFRFGRYSQIKGSPSAPEFLLPDHYKPRYVSHMEIEFDEPVHGPVLLGSGQHFGLGLFAPEEVR